MSADATKYRCTIICKCNGDYAEGYGPTAGAAEKSALVFWRKGGHKKRDISEKIREVAVEHRGGSHYEESNPTP